MQKLLKQRYLFVSWYLCSFWNLNICKIWSRTGFSRQVSEFLKISVLTDHLQLERKSLATPKQGGEKHCKVAYKGKELTVQTLLLLQSSLCLQKRKRKPIPRKKRKEKPIPSKKEKRNQSRAREGTCWPGVGCGGGSQCPCRSGQCCAAVVITGSSWIILFGILYLSMLFCGRSNLLSYFAWKPRAYLIFVISFTQTFCAVKIFYTQNALFVTKLNLRQNSVNRWNALCKIIHCV